MMTARHVARDRRRGAPLRNVCAIACAAVLGVALIACGDGDTTDSPAATGPDATKVPATTSPPETTPPETTPPETTPPETTPPETAPETTVAPVAGLTWTRLADGAGIPVDAQIASVVNGPSGLVAVGVDLAGFPAVWSSADGVTWTPVVDPVAFGMLAQIDDVVAGGPGLVAVGSERIGDPAQFLFRPAVWTSADGSVWTKVALDDQIMGGAEWASMVGVTSTTTGLVAVGYAETGPDRVAAVWTSADGATWARLAHVPEVFGSSGFTSMSAVTAGGPGLVAVGRQRITDDIESGAIWTSPDGVTWARVAADPTVVGGATTSVLLDAVTAAGPGLVAGGIERIGEDFDVALLTSPDGVTWTRVPPAPDFSGPGSQALRDLTAGGPGIVGVGSVDTGDPSTATAAVWVSPDGVAWTRVPDDPAVFGGNGSFSWMEAVAVGGPGLVAVGIGPAIVPVWSSAPS
jgi:hypothetical protein